MIESLTYYAAWCVLGVFR